MKITESQLRKVIRDVINESNLNEMEDPAMDFASSIGAEGHADSSSYLVSNEDKIVLELKMRYLLQKGKEYLQRNLEEAKNDMQEYVSYRQSNMASASSYFLGSKVLSDVEYSVADRHKDEIFSSLHFVKESDEERKALAQLKK